MRISTTKIKTHKLQCFLHVDALRLRSKNGIYSSQWKYALELPEEFGLLETHLSKTPIKQNLKLSKSDGEPLLNASYHGRLRGQGGFLYLIVRRLDIANCVQIVSQFLGSFISHWRGLILLLCSNCKPIYWLQTNAVSLSCGYTYTTLFKESLRSRKSSVSLQHYPITCQLWFLWGSCLDSWCSIMGHMILFDASPIS